MMTEPELLEVAQMAASRGYTSAIDFTADGIDIAMADAAEAIAMAATMDTGSHERQNRTPPKLPPLGQLQPADSVHLDDSRVQWADFWETPVEDADFLIEPIIGRGRAHSLYAPAKAGKSLFLLWVAACAATGRPMLEHPGGEPIRVLYVDLEMTRSDLHERLIAMGFGPDDNLEALAYYSLPAISMLDTALGGQEIVDMAERHDAQLVVIDTLSRVLSGEENSADTMRNFARFAGTPLKAAGRAVIRADHAGKDLEKGTRGTSAKSDDVDVVWRLLPRDQGRFDLTTSGISRVAWIPATVHLQQREDPLSYRITDDAWPAGTKAAADILDRLDVPIDAGRPAARDAVKAAGETVSNSVLAAAIRFRKAERSRLDRLVEGEPE